MAPRWATALGSGGPPASTLPAGGPGLLPPAPLPPFAFDLASGPLYVTHGNVHELALMLADACLIGIDTETRPSFIQNNRHHPTSLLQLAVRRRHTGDEAVAIVDLLDVAAAADPASFSSSSSSTSLSALDALLAPVLRDDAVVKVGQGLLHDFAELCRAYPALTAFHVVHGVVDTNAIYRTLHPHVVQDVSLKNLARAFLHRDLSKAQQCSDWGRRPLSAAQVRYAACDALVLLRLHDAMAQQAAARGAADLAPLRRSYVHGAPGAAGGRRRRGSDGGAGEAVVLAPETEMLPASSYFLPVKADTRAGKHTRFPEAHADPEVAAAAASTAAGATTVPLSGRSGRPPRRRCRASRRRWRWWQPWASGLRWRPARVLALVLVAAALGKSSVATGPASLPVPPARLPLPPLTVDVAAARLRAWAQQPTAGAAPSHAPQRATIDAADAGVKTGAYVSREFLRTSSNTVAYKLCKNGHVTVNGRHAFATQVLRAGDDVEVTVPAAAIDGGASDHDVRKLAALTSFTNYLCAPERQPPCAVLYEDTHLAVVFKPAGVHTMQWVGTRQKKHLALDDALPLLLDPPVAAAAAAGAGRGNHDSPWTTPLARPLPAHRLDARVAGCVVVAKTSLAMKNVTAQFAASGTVRKEYTAIVVGNLTHALLADDVATVFSRAAAVAGWDGRVASAVGGRDAVTMVHVLRVVPCAVDGALTEVRLWPRTGRRHQLRRHLSVLGCPIVGDGLYHAAAFAGATVARRLEAVGLCARTAGGDVDDDAGEEEEEEEEEEESGAGMDADLLPASVPALRQGVGLYLACTGVEVAHPATGHAVCVSASAPPRFNRLLGKALAGHTWVNAKR